MSLGELSGVPLLAILVMALVTLLMRAVGFSLMAYVPLTPRMRRMLNALPGSIVAAIVLPTIAKTGATAALAVIVAVGVMLARRNELIAIAAGAAVAVLARTAGL
jgi:uncharacterized membrane protein